MNLNLLYTKVELLKKKLSEDEGKKINVKSQ